MPNSEEKLRQALKMEALGRLACEMAHDFNNLFTVIIGSSEILLKHFDDNEPLREKVETIRNAGEQAVLLTKGLLTLSKEGVDIADDATTAAQESQKAVVETVEGMQAIAEAAMKAQEVVGATDEQNRGMSEIAKAMGDLQRITQEISTSMDEQEKGANEVSKAIEEINRVTQEVKTAMVQQSSGAEQISKAIEEVSSVAQESEQAAKQSIEATNETGERSADARRTCRGANEIEF